MYIYIYTDIQIYIYTCILVTERKLTPYCLLWLTIEVVNPWLCTLPAREGYLNQQNQPLTMGKASSRESPVVAPTDQSWVYH